MKVKTSELQGYQLDWAVAKCEGTGVEMLGRAMAIEDGVIRQLRYSTDWAQGGPIIEREEIALTLGHKEAHWGASTFDANGRQDRFVYGYGDTPLIAAMRCYVASKLGNEVEIPEELM